MKRVLLFGAMVGVCVAQTASVTKAVAAPQVKYEQLTDRDKVAIRDQQVMITNAEKATQALMDRLRGQLEQIVAAARVAHKCAAKCSIIDNAGDNKAAPVGLSIAREK